METPRRSSIHEVKGPDVQENLEVQEHLTEQFVHPQFTPEELRELTSEENRIVETLVPMMNEFLSQYGAQPLAIRPEHVKILDETKIPPEELQRLKSGAAGGYAQFSQSIIIPSWKVRSLLDFTHILTHELIHFISFNAARARSNVFFPFPHRIGLAVKQPRGTAEDPTVAEYFFGLNEAVTEELVKRFYPRLAEIPELREAMAELEAFRIRRNAPDVAVYSTVQTGDEYETVIYPFAYGPARVRLYNLMDEIYTKYPERFKTSEDVFPVFARAAMTGNIKDMAALIEGLGRGRLQKLARDMP